MNLKGKQVYSNVCNFRLQFLKFRLVEIYDKICQDVMRGEDQCHQLSDEVEPVVEDWFLNKQDEIPNLHSYLCIETTKVCCPANRFGPQCLPCTDCNGNGVCKGNGTRKGSGKCSCQSGYIGDTCNECATQYYESFRDDTKLLCSECHVACEKDTGCNGAGPQGNKKLVISTIWDSKITKYFQNYTFS